MLHDCHITNLANENFINQKLTADQLHQIMIEIQILKCEMKICNPKKLSEEIANRLLDPSYHPRCGNNFSLKLKAIANSIRERIWKVPALYLK